MTWPRHNGWQSPRTVGPTPPPAPERIHHPPDCRIIQGLWHPGDAFESREEIHRWEQKIVQNVLLPHGQATHNIGKLRGLSGSALAQKLDSLIYAFDEPSYEVLAKAGLSAKPYFDYDRSLCASRSLQFRRKLLAIRDALDTYRHVVWCDFDLIELAPFPADFWDVLKAGAPLQAKIRQYMRRKCHWRASQPRVLQGGAFVYCRSIPLIQRTLDVMATPIDELAPRFYPRGTGRTWDDEMAIAWTVDEYNGGWIGQEAYRERGFDPVAYTIRGEIFRDERAVFTAR